MRPSAASGWLIRFLVGCLPRHVRDGYGDAILDTFEAA
jgi:hypothetical protein